ncbi:MFS transporter [Rossellomorea vietnamensis]|uniref:MFS transporter n=1 Tax=Rossellomorea vietnamensis TaxID=218284 RepID=A0ACD4CD88_9BACI|nr:MFS transporter [Rossellomorea vietnamensis]UXH46427.1 MFS transporter [Rossellomorea vietnamensis]
MKFKELHPNIKFRMIDAFMSSAVYNMMLPFLAIYFAGEFGIANAGILLSIYFASGIISSLLGGHISDEYGRRKTLIICGSIRLVSLGIIVLSNSTLFHSAEISFVMFVIINATAGISVPTNQAMLLDVSTLEERKEIFSIEYWTLNTALFLGSVIGGYFFEDYKFYVFLLCFFISSVSLFIVVYFIKESIPKTSMTMDGVSKSKSPLSKLAQNLSIVKRNKAFLLIVLASFLILSVETQAKNYFGVNLSELIESQTLIGGISLSGTQMYGFLRAENALLIMLLSLSVAKWVKNMNGMHLLIIGISLNVLGYMLLVINFNYSILFIAMLIATLGEMLYWPIKKTYLSEYIPENNKGAFLAINGLVGRGAAMTGSFSLIIGAFLNHYYIAMILLVYGLLGTLVFIKVVSNKRMLREV